MIGHMNVVCNTILTHTHTLNVTHIVTIGIKEVVVTFCCKRYVTIRSTVS